MTGVLLACMVSATLAAEITPDGDPVSLGPGKITSTGKWKVAQGEAALRVRMVATPTGGGGGVGGYADILPVGGTYALTVENLAANTEYDVVIYLEYLDANVKKKAVFSQTYKVKTK